MFIEDSEMTIINPEQVTFNLISDALRYVADNNNYEFYLLDDESMILEDNSGFKLEVTLYGENNIISMKCSSIPNGTKSITHAQLTCNHLNMHTPFTRFCVGLIPNSDDMEFFVRTSNDTLYDEGLHIKQFVYNVNYFLKSSKRLIAENF